MILISEVRLKCSLRFLTVFFAAHLNAISNVVFFFFKIQETKKTRYLNCLSNILIGSMYGMARDFGAGTDFVLQK